MLLFPPWTWVIGFFIGSTIGSFLNVVIYRMPRGLSLSEPKNSFCPKCKHPLGVPDLFPLFSWLISGGKCRYCKSPVSVRYFVVEMVTGIAWGAIWYQYLVRTWDVPVAVAYALTASALVAIIFIDIELYLIPDQINAFLLITGLAYNGYLIYNHDPRAYTSFGMPSAVFGALMGVAILWGIAFLGRIMFRKDAMGHGDIKMARGIGAVLFVGPAVMSFGLAVVLGAVLGIAQVLLTKSPETERPYQKLREDLAEGEPCEGGGVNLTKGAEPEQVPETSSEEVDELPPESIGSLLASGLGYVLCIDVIGLFYVPLYEKWFHENPFTPVQEMEEFEVERTMIPFGPYLALGAIVAVIFKDQLTHGWENYVNWVQAGR